MTHFLLSRPSVVRDVELAMSAHLGTAWTAIGFTDLNDRASHPAGIFHGDTIDVFAKLDPSTAGADPSTDRSEQFTAEIRGLELLRGRAGVTTPRAIGIVATDAGSMLLLSAIAEIPAQARSAAQWRSIGTALATLHRAYADRFGLDFDGFFGPLRQDNQPVTSHRWADFYAERRMIPLLRSAVDSGHLAPDLADGIDRVIERLPVLCGPEPRPTLVHGDAQQNNLLTAADGAVLVDAAPYFGHPEIDLALIDYFEPVPEAVFDAYREHTSIDSGFAERRELWRLFGYLAVVTVDGSSDFGRPILGRLAAAVARYR